MTTNTHVFSSLIGQRSRPQELLTPQPIIDWLLSQWGEISLDAASDVRGHVPALHRYTGDYEDGLQCGWSDRTWCNPPFAETKRWLRHADTIAELEDVRITMLVPVRTHRPWWRESAFVRSDAIVWLNAKQQFGFYGHFEDVPQANGKTKRVAVQDPDGPLTWYEQSFPTPLCLLCKGWIPSSVPGTL